VKSVAFLTPVSVSPEKGVDEAFESRCHSKWARWRRKGMKTQSFKSHAQFGARDCGETGKLL
jgi:hypothetical protein